MRMTKRIFFRRALIILLVIALFLYGKFYREIESFLFDISTLIGFLFVVIGFLSSAVFYFQMELKNSKEKVRRYCDRNQLQDEIMYSLKHELRELKAKVKSKKKK